MNLGLVYILLAEFLWAIETVLIRKFFSNSNSIFLSAVGSLIGSVFYLPMLFLFKEKVDFKNGIILLLYGFISFFLAQMFYITGIQKGVNAFAVSLTTLFFPFFTFILAAIFLKEILTLKTIIGGIIMMIGFLIISF